jgi:hypothetical protein
LAQRKGGGEGKRVLEERLRSRGSGAKRRRVRSRKIGERAQARHQVAAVVLVRGVGDLLDRAESTPKLGLGLGLGLAVGCRRALTDLRGLLRWVWGRPHPLRRL